MEKPCYFQFINIGDTTVWWFCGKRNLGLVQYLVRCLIVELAKSLQPQDLLKYNVMLLTVTDGKLINLSTTITDVFQIWDQSLHWILRHCIHTAIQMETHKNSPNFNKNGTCVEQPNKEQFLTKIRGFNVKNVVRNEFFKNNLNNFSRDCGLDFWVINQFTSLATWGVFTWSYGKTSDTETAPWLNCSCIQFKLFLQHKPTQFIKKRSLTSVASCPWWKEWALSDGHFIKVCTHGGASLTTDTQPSRDCQLETLLLTWINFNPSMDN